MQLTKFISLALLTGLAGCSTLPTNGPTRGQIEKSVQAGDANLPIQLVHVQTAGDIPVPPGNVAP